MVSRFAFYMVVPETEGKKYGDDKPQWLVIEKMMDGKETCKFYLSSLPVSTKRKEIVRLIHQRWRTEQAYRELKQEFRFDHYEGRSFIGWHHHVTVTLVCMAFTVAEQARLFPPEDPEIFATAQCLAA